MFNLYIHTCSTYILAAVLSVWFSSCKSYYYTLQRNVDAIKLKMGKLRLSFCPEHAKGQVNILDIIYSRKSIVWPLKTAVTDTTCLASQKNTPITTVTDTTYLASKQNTPKTAVTDITYLVSNPQLQTQHMWS